MLSRAALLALALGACSGAAGNDKGPQVGGNETAAATAAQQASVTSPLVGLWTQTNPPCATGTPPPAKVEELEFEPGGRALVTFGAFETYHDYWGPYRHDPASGALRMTVERGNSIPRDVDLDGSATITPDGELVLSGISFGTPAGASPEARNCTLRFTRRR
ncbi:MAG TPA: hypothetical protein VEC11_06150 [Allosphingosinicella sp.]|nr:hypothetical protein [Allosphingosinicella sp.]